VCLNQSPGIQIVADDSEKGKVRKGRLMTAAIRARGKLGAAVIIIGIGLLALWYAITGQFYIGGQQVTANQFNTFCRNGGYAIASPGSCSSAGLYVRDMYESIVVGAI
jgi:hypothetical protein